GDKPGGPPPAAGAGTAAAAAPSAGAAAPTGTSAPPGTVPIQLGIKTYFVRSADDATKKAWEDGNFVASEKELLQDMNMIYPNKVYAMY
ncbi:hypothetical protein QPL67_28420, partial [Escherichia coli]|uniref:hypothetical protein n=1 Tax=Escherichia coli TaxID=562 RepID=UPI0026FB773A